MFAVNIDRYHARATSVSRETREMPLVNADVADVRVPSRSMRVEFADFGLTLKCHRAESHLSGTPEICNRSFKYDVLVSVRREREQERNRERGGKGRKRGKEEEKGA